MSELVDVNQITLGNITLSDIKGYSLLIHGKNLNQDFNTVDQYHK